MPAARINKVGFIIIFFTFVFYSRKSSDIILFGATFSVVLSEYYPSWAIFCLFGISIRDKVTIIAKRE
jgi:hypothetical protein